MTSEGRAERNLTKYLGRLRKLEIAVSETSFTVVDDAQVGFGKTIQRRNVSGDVGFNDLSPEVLLSNKQRSTTTGNFPASGSCTWTFTPDLEPTSIALSLARVLRSFGSRSSTGKVLPPNSIICTCTRSGDCFVSGPSGCTAWPQSCSTLLLSITCPLSSYWRWMRRKTNIFSHSSRCRIFQPTVAVHNCPAAKKTKYPHSKCTSGNTSGICHD